MKIVLGTAKSFNIPVTFFKEYNIPYHGYSDARPNTGNIEDYRTDERLIAFVEKHKHDRNFHLTVETVPKGCYYLINYVLNPDFGDGEELIIFNQNDLEDWKLAAE